jgi:hypothetical protein
MAKAVPAWMTNPIQAVFRTTIRNRHDGAVCASREAPAVKFADIIKWLIIAFVVWWIIQEPSNAAHLIHNIGTFLTTAAHGLSNFVTSI